MMRTCTEQIPRLDQINIHLVSSAKQFKFFLCWLSVSLQDYTKAISSNRPELYYQHSLVHGGSAGWWYWTGLGPEDITSWAGTDGTIWYQQFNFIFTSVLFNLLLILNPGFKAKYFILLSRPLWA